MATSTTATPPRFNRIYKGLILGLQGGALSAIVLLALVLTVTSLLAILGVLPWLEIGASLNGVEVPFAGMALQLGMTIFCLALAFYIPTNARILRLERSHRKFEIDMDDIARAYAAAHAADREGIFNLSEEFDEMRERIDHLRSHPDLGALEPELLEVAAQMSYATRDLAKTYSTQRVERAKAFLRQRQEEVAQYRETIQTAQRICDELRRWVQDIDADERMAQNQIKRLDEDLQEILPSIGYAFEPVDSTVVPMSTTQKPRALPKGTPA